MLLRTRAEAMEFSLLTLAKKPRSSRPMSRRCGTDPTTSTVPLTSFEVTRQAISCICAALGSERVRSTVGLLRCFDLPVFAIREILLVHLSQPAERAKVRVVPSPCDLGSSRHSTSCLQLAWSQPRSMLPAAPAAPWQRDRNAISCHPTTSPLRLTLLL